jgi:hypothetical protein
MAWTSTPGCCARDWVSPSQACVAWPPANDTDPVVQDFVRCCLDNKR